jgi:hypothetical protein
LEKVNESREDRFRGRVCGNVLTEGGSEGVEHGRRSWCGEEGAQVAEETAHLLVGPVVAVGGVHEGGRLSRSTCR